MRLLVMMLIPLMLEAQYYRGGKSAVSEPTTRTVVATIYTETSLNSPWTNDGGVNVDPTNTTYKYAGSTAIQVPNASWS